jgi:hypothetical protein
MNLATLPFGGTVPIQCAFGRVNLFRFIQAPQPGSVVGTITPAIGGNAISLVQTQATSLGGVPLATVDGQFATVCGAMRGAALDVLLVLPFSGAGASFGLPATTGG